MIYHLNNTKISPKIYEIISNKKEKIELFFEKKFQNLEVPIYSSVDIRDSEFKISAVDTNLFPSSFSILSETDITHASTIFSQYLSTHYPNTQKILLMVEYQPRNTHYLKNIAQLFKVIQQTGVAVNIGSLNIKDTTKVDQHNLKLHPIENIKGMVSSNNFMPDLILLNDDLISSDWEKLNNLSSQQTIPSVHLGWHQRKKSTHFTHYQSIARELGEITGIDSWLLGAFFSTCQDNNLYNNVISGCLRRDSEAIFKKIKQKYDDYGIEKKPFLFIKSDSGSYGMGVMPIFDMTDFDTLNRQQRKKMRYSKGKSSVEQVFIQEGVASNLIDENKNTAELTFLYIGHQLVKVFSRSHQEKNTQDNLNSPGMTIQPININDQQCDLFYAHHVIGRIALLAATKEAQHV